MALLAVFVMVIVMGTAYITVYFFKALNWGPTLIGIYQSTSMAAHFISLMFILPLLALLKFPDPLISLIAMFFNIFMNLFLGLSHRTYQVFIGECLKVDKNVTKNEAQLHIITLLYIFMLTRCSDNTVVYLEIKLTLKRSDNTKHEHYYTTLQTVQL